MEELENERDIIRLKNIINQQNDQIINLKIINKGLVDKINSLEKDFYDRNNYQSINWIKTDKLQKSLHEQIDNTEKEKVRLQDEIRHITRQFQTEKDSIIKQTEETIQKQKNVIDTMSIKVDNSISLERLNDVHSVYINQLESELSLKAKEFKFNQERKKFKTEMKFDELRQKMIDQIEQTQKNVEQMNISHMDISTKLILLQNHQLLIELEYQSQQVEELIKKKEINENKIFQLQRDIEIHNEVELVLAEKNKKLLEVLKKFNKEKDTNKTFNKINTRVAILNSTDNSGYYVNTNPQTDENFNLNITHTKNSIYNNDNISGNSAVKNQNMIKLEKKIHELEKIIEKKKVECINMKTNYDLIQEQVLNNEKKYRNIFTLFQEGLDKLAEDESIKKSTEVSLSVENIKNADFTILSSEKKYAILLLLMKNILPMINLNDLKFTDISKFNFEKVKVKFHFPKTKNLDNIIKNITSYPQGSKSVKHKQKFSLDLPNIKKLVDRRFVIPNKPSVFT